METLPPKKPRKRKNAPKAPHRIQSVILGVIGDQVLRLKAISNRGELPPASGAMLKQYYEVATKAEKDRKETAREQLEAMSFSSDYEALQTWVKQNKDKVLEMLGDVVK